MSNSEQLQDAINNSRYTTWGSKNAEDMFRIATILAGFDSKILMKIIYRIQRDKSRVVNLATVEKALGLYETYGSRTWKAGDKTVYKYRDQAIINLFTAKGGPNEYQA